MQLQTIELNPNEMASYKWVGTSHLMDARNICWLDSTERFKGMMRSLGYYRLADNDNSNDGLPLSCVDRVLSPAMNVGMGERLYGLTMYIMLVVFRGVLERL